GHIAQNEVRALERWSYSTTNPGKNGNKVDKEMKNYLRATEKSATDASIMYKIMQSCKAAGLCLVNRGIQTI
ncbi:hypothetical protein MKX03_031025, partial [Papaver bracteatum]